MSKEIYRTNDTEIQDWLKTKKNKSHVTRKALRLLYELELNKNKKEPIEVEI